MEYQIIPIEVIKDIESWLFNDMGFSYYMLDKELDFISDVYLLGSPSFSEEVQDLYISIKRKDKEIPYPNSIMANDEERYNFSLTVGKNIILESGNYKSDDILRMWNLYNQKDSPNDEKVYLGLLLMVGIFYKHKETGGYFDYPDMVENAEQHYYTYSVRPDMLKLYKMFHEKRKSKNNTVTIEYNKQKIELPSGGDWFVNMITQYLDKYLGVENLEEAEKELSHDYPSIGVRGRKKESTLLDTILLSIHNLLKHSSFAVGGKTLTNNEAEFVLDLIKYLGLIEPDSTKDDILNLRATINNLHKYGVRPNWWNIPLYKVSPNNPLLHLKSFW